MEKRGQSTIEFMIVFSAIMLFFIIFFSVIQGYNSKKFSERENLILQDLGLNIRDEINLATGSSEGYFREFEIPMNLFGKDFEMNITESHVHVATDNFSYYYSISNVTGELKKGTNNITKENGTVYLNK